MEKTELEKQDEKAFKDFLNCLSGTQLLLFKKHLTARHSLNQEIINLLFKD